MKTEKSGVFEFGEMATFKREARFQGNPMKSCSFKVPTFLGREPNSLHPSTEVEFIIYLFRCASISQTHNEELVTDVFEVASIHCVKSK